MIRKSQLYSSLWKSCDELRGGMDASQHKDYILTLLFVKYVSDKARADPDSMIEVPEGASSEDMLALKGKPHIGEGIDKIISKLAEANGARRFEVSPHQVGPGDERSGAATRHLISTWSDTSADVARSS